MKDISPEAWIDLAGRLRTNPELYQKYITNRNKGVFHKAPADSKADACALSVCTQSEFELCTGKLGDVPPHMAEHKC